MAPRYFLGVDPGLSGALAFYDPAADELIVHDMPVHTITINRAKKRRLDLYALGMMLDAMRNDTARAMVEDVEIGRAHVSPVTSRSRMPSSA